MTIRRREVIARKFREHCRDSYQKNDVTREFLHRSENVRGAPFDDVLAIGEPAAARDRDGSRREFCERVH